MLTQVTVHVDGIPYDVAIRINEKGRLTMLALRSPSGGRWVPFSAMSGTRLGTVVRWEASGRGLFDQAREYHAALAAEDDAERAAHPERFIGGADTAQKEE